MRPSATSAAAEKHTIRCGSTGAGGSVAQQCVGTMLPGWCCCAACLLALALLLVTWVVGHVLAAQQPAGGAHSGGASQLRWRVHTPRGGGHMLQQRMCCCLLLLWCLIRQQRAWEGSRSEETSCCPGPSQRRAARWPRPGPAPTSACLKGDGKGGAHWVSALLRLAKSRHASMQPASQAASQRGRRLPMAAFAPDPSAANSTALLCHACLLAAKRLHAHRLVAAPSARAARPAATAPRARAAPPLPCPAAHTAHSTQESK